MGTWKWKSGLLGLGTRDMLLMFSLEVENMGG